MKHAFRTVLIGVVLAVAGVGVTWAVDQADPIVGTWTLNLANSKFSPGPAPKSQTRTYSKSDDGISLTVTGVAADGSAISQQSTFKYDNKAYPITGAPNYDAISLKRVNGSTVKAAMMKAGKQVGTTTRTISAHGKVLTLSTKATGADGKAYDDVAVFDKQ